MNNRPLCVLVASIILICFAGPIESAQAAVESPPLGAGEQPPRGPSEAEADAIRDTSQGFRSNAALRRMNPSARAKALGRCVPIAELTYCIGSGWGARPDYNAIARRTAGTQPTGDLSGAAWVSRRLSMTDAQRRAAELAEIREALRAVAKMRYIRAVASGAKDARMAALANASAIMTGYQTRQIKANYCGPATLQSIDWADDQTKNDQNKLAANQLDTRSEGTSLASMVSAVNRITSWPAKAGGKYQVQSVAGWSTGGFYGVHRAQLGDESPTPIIEHPKLVKKHFHYLRFDHSGHFQVGRGFRTVDGVPEIHIFEVFNEADFNRGGAQSWGPRTVRAEALLRATKLNPLQNFGL